MWQAERGTGALALLRVPVASFGDGRGAAPRGAYRPLPSLPGHALHNRYVGDWLLVGAGGAGAAGEPLLGLRYAAPGADRGVRAPDRPAPRCGTHRGAGPPRPDGGPCRGATCTSARCAWAVARPAWPAATCRPVPGRARPARTASTTGRPPPTPVCWVCRCSDLVTGGAGFLGSHLCERCWRGARGALRRQLLHRHAATTSSTCWATRASS
jgi:hypothetical protein